MCQGGEKTRTRECFFSNGTISDDKFCCSADEKDSEKSVCNTQLCPRCFSCDDDDDDSNDNDNDEEDNDEGDNDDQNEDNDNDDNND